MRRLKFILALFFIVNLHLQSQNEAQKWYFGYNCGLDFSTNPPSVISSPVFNSYEGGATISDSNGNLLFYTDAITVWDKSHAVMANGTGLFGDMSSTQSSVIVKQPGPGSIYYIFTLDAMAQTDGFRYSLVDMSLAAGMGSVTAKNILLYTPSQEKLTAVKHCNGSDVWVITHSYSSNTFNSYLVTASGISALPVQSSVGPIMGSQDFIGAMKVSPNGKKLAVVSYGGAGTNLFDFDASTGTVSNYLHLSNGGYGCEFSPDGSKLYVGQLGGYIHQWDVCAGINSAIASSSVAIYTNTISSNYVGSLQLAPNGKIYVSMINSQSLSVINNPNASGAACNFILFSQSAGTGTASLGLPNFVTSFLRAPKTFSVNQSCSVVSFTAPSPVVTSCGALDTFTSTSWLFDDPASGTLNTSSLSIVTHTFSGPGIYHVKLLCYSSCGTDTISQVINVLSTPLSIIGSFSLCSGNSGTLQASGAVSYSWSSGALTSSIVISPTITTIYSVAASYTNGCALSSSSMFTVSVYPSPTLTISGSPQLCAGNTRIFTASGASSYSWNTGAATNTLSVSPAFNTTYAVTGTNTFGCSNTLTTQIFVSYPPVVSAAGASTICAGTEAILTASGAQTYSWSSGATTNTIHVIPSTSSIYTVSGENVPGCASMATVTVVVNPLPLLIVTGNSVCPGSIATVSATGAYSYNWSNGITTNTNNLSFMSNMVYTVTGTDISGCISSKTVAVIEKQLPSLSVKSATICPGVEITLYADVSPTTNITYAWLPGGITTATLSVSPISTSHYTVTVFLDGCPATVSNTVITQYTASPSTAFSYPPLCVSYGDTLPFKTKDFADGGYFSSDPGLSINGMSGSINPSKSLPGTYVVTYVLAAQSCTEAGIGSASVNIEEAPVLHISPEIQIAPGTGTNLFVTGSSSYTWTTDPSISCVDCSSPYVSPAQTTTYCVWATDKQCKTKACVTIKVGCDGNDFSLPNAFSPNGDGTNDSFCIQGWDLCIKSFSALIFNRWGELVFESNNPSFCWDGTFKGKLLDSDVAVYLIDAVFSDGSRIKKKGNIALLR